MMSDMKVIAEMSSHTPGPWTIIGSLGTGRHCIDGAGTHKVPVAVTEWQAGGVSDANARLIATAPDYHELAEDALPILDAVLEDREATTGEEDEILRDLIARFRAVIAKAKGR